MRRSMTLATSTGPGLLYPIRIRHSIHSDNAPSETFNHGLRNLPEGRIAIEPISIPANSPLNELKHYAEPTDQHAFSAGSIVDRCRLAPHVFDADINRRHRVPDQIGVPGDQLIIQ